MTNVLTPGSTQAPPTIDVPHGDEHQRLVRLHLTDGCEGVRRTVQQVVTMPSWATPRDREIILHVRRSERDALLFVLPPQRQLGQRLDHTYHIPEGVEPTAVIDPTEDAFHWLHSEPLSASPLTEDQINNTVMLFGRIVDPPLPAGRHLLGSCLFQTVDTSREHRLTFAIGGMMSDFLARESIAHGTVQPGTSPAALRAIVRLGAAMRRKWFGKKPRDWHQWEPPTNDTGDEA
jgi:hypothetical protein